MNDFEAFLRQIAERVCTTDFDDVARSAGLDPDQARGWVDDAAQWLRSQAAPQQRPPVRADAPVEDPLSGARPHPLDVPTPEQGVALAALDSGRWTIEPGTAALTVHGEGPGPSDALGLVRELRVRDWIDADGEVTVTGRHALGRWLGAGTR